MFFFTWNEQITTDRDLDGDIIVNAVLVIEVDAVDAQPGEAGLTCRSHERRVPADLPLAVG
jgi:hypothetical protein